MAQTSQIEWTDATWNPVTGCTKIGAGCDNCYAMRFAERWRGTANHPYEQGFDLKLWPDRLLQPLKWKKSKMIFVNSMSDLFQKEIPHEFINQVFEVMEKADHHIYQVLTKRSSLMKKYIAKRYAESPVPSHIWLGVSIEDNQHLSRLKHLKDTNASMKFISFEPLLSSLGKIDIKGIDWAIVGGESGPKARVMQPEWAREIRDQCQSQDVSFFFKQWGGIRPKTGGRELDGVLWDGFPKMERAA